MAYDILLKLSWNQSIRASQHIGSKEGQSTCRCCGCMAHRPWQLKHGFYPPCKVADISQVQHYASYTYLLHIGSLRIPIPTPPSFKKPLSQRKVASTNYIALYLIEVRPCIMWLPYMASAWVPQWGRLQPQRAVSMASYKRNDPFHQGWPC